MREGSAIHFAPSTSRVNQITVKEQLAYVQHVRRLFIHKYPNWSYALQFAVVGASGVLVNLLALTALLSLGIGAKPAVAFAIVLSMLSNFALNRRFTFSYARRGDLFRQLARYVTACSGGALINFAVTMAMLVLIPTTIPQVAAIAGVLAGMVANFVASRFFVFRAIG